MQNSNNLDFQSCLSDIVPGLEQVESNNVNIMHTLDSKLKCRKFIKTFDDVQCNSTLL